jgi:hypothetical protein
MLQPERDKNKTVANVVILNMPLNVKMTNIISHILKTFEVSLWKNSSCTSDSTEDLLVDWIELTRNYTEYSFVELELKVC